MIVARQGETVPIFVSKKWNCPHYPPWQFIHHPSSFIILMSSPAVQPLLALLASRVGGNPTQYMYEKAFSHHDLDWRFLTFEIEPANLGDAMQGLRALGFRGGYCADPHKQAVLPWLDRSSDTAAVLGSVNLFYREENALVGENTEGKGVVQAIQNVLDPAGKRIALLGAGRAARAVAVELAAIGAAGITIVNRTESRATELATLLTEKYSISVAVDPWCGDYAVPSETDILIHATGIRQVEGGTRLPVVSDSLRPELLVADLTADSPHTWLLDEAAQRGCQILDGISMFIEQTAIGFQLWTGVDPNRQVLHEAVEEFLEL
jgi:shikimate dehydrogenase